MVGLLITILVAALAYLLLVAITGSTIVGIVAAILILIGGIPTGGVGFGSRWGGGRTAPQRRDFCWRLRRDPRGAGSLHRIEPEVGLEPTACSLQESCSTS